jgi:phosphatidylserine/phosphatidylglycerophosphate/cardiolipin synthase-like enzyme
VRLLAGPTNARERIIDFISSTQKSLDIYAPSFSDAGLLTKLSELCYQKKIIRILLANYQNESTQRPDYGTCIQVRIMKKPLHAKSIIRDNQSGFVGSFNYTKNSLENNREIGLFVS